MKFLCCLDKKPLPKIVKKTQKKNKFDIASINF